MATHSQLVDPEVEEIEEVYLDAEDYSGDGDSYADGVLDTLRWLFEGCSRPDF